MKGEIRQMDFRMLAAVVCLVSVIIGALLSEFGKSRKVYRLAWALLTVPIVGSVSLVHYTDTLNTKYKVEAQNTSIESIIYTGVSSKVKPKFAYKLDGTEDYKDESVLYIDNVEKPYLGYVTYTKDGGPSLLVRKEYGIIMDSKYKEYGVQQVYDSNNQLGAKALVYQK